MTTATDLRDMLNRAARMLSDDLDGASRNPWWAERRRLLAEVKALLAAPAEGAAPAPAADAYQATYTAQPGYHELLAFARAYHGAVCPERELAAMAARALAIVDGRPAPASSGGTAAESLAVQARGRRAARAYGSSPHPDATEMAVWPATAAKAG